MVENLVMFILSVDSNSTVPLKYAQNQRYKSQKVTWLREIACTFELFRLKSCRLWLVPPVRWNLPGNLSENSKGS